MHVAVINDPKPDVDPTSPFFSHVYYFKPLVIACSVCRHVFLFLSRFRTIFGLLPFFHYYIFFSVGRKKCIVMLREACKKYPALGGPKNPGFCARPTHLYCYLHEFWMSVRVRDAVVCVVALNFGHIAPHSLIEFINATKPLGYICFSTREDYFQSSSKLVQIELENNNKWRLVNSIIRDSSIKDMPHRHWQYQVLQ